MRFAVKTAAWIPSAEEWKRAFDFLQKCEPVEVQRINRLKIEEDRKRSLVGRLLLRYASGVHANMDPLTVQLARTPQNKPVCLNLANKAELNVSHHGDWVVLVSDVHRVIGVDVMKYEEPRRGVDAFFTSMRRQFTESEWRRIDGSLPKFYQFWALKESYIKAVGIGLGFNLQRASFSFTDDSKAQVEIDGELQPDWDFWVSGLDEMHCVAVAWGPLMNSDGSPHQEDSTMFPFAKMTVHDLFEKLSI